MYAYIKGILAYKHNDHLVVEANGIGYKIHTSLPTLGNAAPQGSETKVFTHLYVREDIMNLYGFLTQEELSMFELLITVSGVGPKAAISLLSTVSPSKFGLAVITEDAKTLTRAQGIGSKVAQRIILELKDKLKKEQMASVDHHLKGELPEITSKDTMVAEAVSALMVLGYTAVEANRSVASVYSEGIDLEEIIRNALKGLSTGR